METKDKTRLLIVIDANSLIHRAYHALPPLTTKGGELVNAVYGFFSIFLKALRELNPDFVATAFDLAAPTFRHQIFCHYKAKRKKPPEDFYRQIPKIKEILNSFGIKIFEKQGFEADDVIGTIAMLAETKSPNLETVILSSDADVLQLVDAKTKVLILKKGVSQTILYDEKGVQEKYQGLTPRQLIDFKALRGDPSDNIPGVFGIGEKTAAELINRFNSLENLYSSLDQEEARKSLKESLLSKLVNQREEAFLSKKLAEICRDIDLNFDLESCSWKGYDRDGVTKIFKNLGFFSLLAKLPEDN